MLTSTIRFLEHF